MNLPVKPMKARQPTEADRSFGDYKALTLFDGIERNAIDDFIDAGRTLACKKGKLLYHEGDKATHFYIVCSGWVKLFRVTEEGDEVNLSMLTAGSITGENALFERGRFACSARVVEDARIIALPLSLLKSRLGADIRLAHNMMAYMVKNQRHREVMLEDFMLYSAPQRIGCFLLALCPETKQTDGAVITLPYDKKLIASTLGMKDATFSRALNVLREETGLHIAGTRVKIASMARLLKFVDGCYSLEASHG